MPRIIHLSDFHLNPKNLRDWDDFIKSAITKELRRINNQKKIDFMFLTGDLLDKGGIDYKSPQEGFALFKKEIITPILSSIDFPIENFLLTPGNHDVQRNVEPEFIEIGLGHYFKDIETINDFIIKGKEGDIQGLDRIKSFKKFESDIYKNIKLCELSKFDSNFVYQYEHSSVGVSCLNSSWRSYDSNSDKGKILIGEAQISNAWKYIKNCDLKIALIHHPFDWINDVEKNIIQSHLQKNYDLIFTGHVHEGESLLSTGFTGSLFVNIAPGAITNIRSDSKKYANGFTIVDYMGAENYVKCEYRKYNHESREFVLNTDLGEEGTYEFEIPKKKGLTAVKNIKENLRVITDLRYDEMNSHLISSGAEYTPRTIKDAFILPNLSKSLADKDHEKNEPEAYLSLQDIIDIDNDVLIFGIKESGKTMLLHRLVVEYVDRFDFKKTIPIYLDFYEISNRPIETCLRNYISCTSDTIEQILKGGNAVILVDNLQWDIDEFGAQIKKLSDFKRRFPKAKFICAATARIVGVIPNDFIFPLNFNFEPFFIENLSVKHIKGIIRQWLPTEDSVSVEKKLERIVDSFKSFSLPRTAMSVNLFLWSFENKERKPVNNSTLLEIFIEIVLEKLQGQEIYRETFDFKNKLLLLAHIASVMLDKGNPNYSLTKIELEETVEKYLKEKVGFDFDPQKLINYFLQRGIFVQYQRNNVKFRFSCFFHFFLAKRMEFDFEFKEHVLDEGNFHNFHYEIDYYSGLVRSDKKLLEFLHNFVIKEFEPYQHILNDVNLDDYFSSSSSIVKDIQIDAIKKNKPTETDLDKRVDELLESLPNPDKIFEKKGRKSLEQLLIMIGNVLRNSEGVEDLELKKKVYETIIHDSMIFCVLYHLQITDYVEKNNGLPPGISSKYKAGAYLRHIPFFIQSGLTTHMGTSKLAPVIAKKIATDLKEKSRTKSDIEKFLSVFIYSDVQGQNYPKYIKALVKSVRNNVVRDYCLFKLTYYYYVRTRLGSKNEEFYLEALADLKMRTQSLPAKMRDTVIKSLKKSKKKKSTEF